MDGQVGERGEGRGVMRERAIRWACGPLGNRVGKHCVAEKARALGLPGTELVEERYEEPMVTLAEARRACLSGEDDLRTAALRLLIASNKTTTPLCPEEQALLEEVRSWS